MNQKVIQLYLVAAGHTVDFVVDGREAVEAVNSQSYDLVLMDIHMPKMDGITAAKLIREQGGFGETVPIIAVTAMAMKGDRENFLAAGMNDYVSKPIDRQKLFAAIDGCSSREPIDIRHRTEVVKQAAQDVVDASDAAQDVVDASDAATDLRDLMGDLDALIEEA